MLPEFLSFGSLGIESVENVLQVGFGYAGAVILHAQFDDPPLFANAHEDSPARRAEGLGVADQVAQHLNKAVFNRPDRDLPGRCDDVQLRVILRITRGLVQLLQGAQDGHDVDPLGRDPRQFGIQARRVAHVADQSVQAHHVLADNRQKLALAGGILDATQGLDGTADGCQGIFDLVRHVGGEPLDRIHACP